MGSAGRGYLGCRHCTGPAGRRDGEGTGDILVRIAESVAECRTQGAIDGSYADTCMVRLRQLSIVCLDEIDDCEIMALAHSHRLSAYDASYLALALREGCALVSLDRRLNEAAVAEA
ncbi:MAG: type II toxin-antitoxin system VapC family toxin [Gammaproteobacteria bacterium]|nr:type II toxin-antitoxin system VapC family toxin [Gammaproteobacteria bacterium]